LFIKKKAIVSKDFTRGGMREKGPTARIIAGGPEPRKELKSKRKANLSGELSGRLEVGTNIELQTGR